MKVKTLITNLDGYLYLQRENTEQRGGKFTEQHEKSIKENFKTFAINGEIEILDRNLGGGCGSKDPSTWTSWSVEKMARMLEKQNIPFKIGEGEVIPFHI